MATTTDAEEYGLTVEVPGRAEGLRFAQVIGNLPEAPEVADPRHGLAPRGAQADPASPVIDFAFAKRDEVWAEGLAELYESANAQQWDATTDIAWDRLVALPDEVEAAVAQVMTFLAENEFVALYLPAKLLPRVHPEYTEVALVLASQVKDEARHIEVFTKRALAGGKGLGKVEPATQWALRSLLFHDDFTEVAFLLHVVGEGTFLKLLRFLESHAPDEVTRHIMRRTRRDEARHVSYGLDHVGWRLARQPELAAQLLAAAERRAAFVRASAGTSAAVQTALATLAGGGGSDRQIESGMAKVKDLYHQMHAKRLVRLRRAGFPEEVAQEISSLHGEAVKTFM
ncbi:MAG: ferritin-like domain-containing protein [Actinomycetota bacterium]|nr:ferritin-like domain-containing protein [Actinomycetota bacterium]